MNDQPTDPIALTDPVVEPASDPIPAPLAESAGEPVVSAPREEPGGSMTFFEHLTELRKRIINSLIAIVIGAFIGFYLSSYLIDFIIAPMLKALHQAHLDEKLIYTHPAAYLNLMISFGIYMGVALASPYVLYQIWLFVAPALYKHERGAITGFLFSAVFLFFSGVAFAYFIALPRVLFFLVSFQGMPLPFLGHAKANGVVPMISISEYFDLTLTILLVLGLLFELPVLVFFLSLFGIVTPKFLIKNFRYAMLIITLVAAFVTPTPDAMTMLLFMAPMVGLYFVSIGVSAAVVRRRERRLAAETAEAR
jgi:sec-independent protein translocase protein TatC